MSGTVQLPPDSTGKKVDTSELSVSGATVERQRIVLADPTDAAGLADVNAKGVQGSYALQVQAYKDSGRTVMALVSNNVISVGTSEAMMSTTGTVLYRGGSSVSGTNGSYTVTAGKTFRMSQMTLSYTAGVATASGCRVFLRSIFSASATTTTSSPIALAAAAVPATASAMGVVTIPFDEGIELAGGTTFGLSNVQTTTAITNLLSVSVTGYEY